MTMGLTSPTSTTGQILKNGSAVISFDANNNATFAGNVAPTVNPTFRNRIINGAMVIDQRNAGASVTVTNGLYTLDRWYFGNTQLSKLTTQQNAGGVTPPAGFTNYLGVTSSSSYTPLSTDVFILVQPIEGYNISDFAFGTASAKTVTLSFWVRSSLTGTFGGNIENAAETQCYPFNYTISSANTWTQVSVTIPGSTTGTWNTNNTVGLYLCLDLGSGSSTKGTANTWQAGGKFSPTGTTNLVSTSGATLYITGVQLEAGSVATPFEQRLYGTELALCQRYFYVIASGSGYISNAAAQTTTNAFGMYTLPVTMRTSPTGSVVTGTNYYRFLANDIDDYVDSVYANGQSPNNVIIGNSTQISNTQGRPGVFTATNAASFVAASAEL
jgi:hypothetical protein